MSAKTHSYFDDVAREFRTLALQSGYEPRKYPNRSVRVHAYHDRIKFRLRDNWDALRVAIFVVQEPFEPKLQAYDLAERIFEEMHRLGYVVHPGDRPRRFADQEALLRPAPRRVAA